MAEMNRAMIRSKKETLEEMKIRLDNNLAEKKLLIETTMEHLINAFFAKQEESKKKK